MKTSKQKQITELAKWVSSRNSIDNEIAKIIQRPAQRSHIGEFIASLIFDIKLEAVANQKGSDGNFKSGTLKGKSVNIKFYGRSQRILDLPDYEEGWADYHLVLSGPLEGPGTSKGATRPLCIKFVYLFKTDYIIEQQKHRGAKVGIASSIPKKFWEEALIYPYPLNNPPLKLTKRQINLLRLFSYFTVTHT